MQYLAKVKQQYWFMHMAAAVGLMLMFADAQAGRPMEVDDAGIVGAGACELEAWSEHRRHSNSYWAVPACNVTGNLEIGLGAAIDDHRHGTVKTAVMEVKSVVAEGLGGHSDMALALAFERGHFRGERENEWHLNLPITTFFASERLAWHNNLGTLYAEDEKHHAFAWGTGLEYGLTDKVEVYGEVFGDSTERPFYQLSAGYWVVPEQFQLTLGVGDKLEGDKHERWVSFGINLEKEIF